MKFKYENASPGKTFVGAMPLAKEQYSGGYQPATLTENSGTAEVGIMCGAIACGPISPGQSITTKEQLEATYVQLDTLEIMVYGSSPKRNSACR